MSFDRLLSWGRRLDGEGSAVQQSVKGCLGDVVAPGDARTTACLTHELANGMQEVDVVAGQVVDPLERGQRWPLQSVVANQTAHNRPILLFNLCRFRDYADEYVACLSVCLGRWLMRSA